MRLFAQGYTSHGRKTARARVRCGHHTNTAYSTQFRGVFGSVGLPLMAKAARAYLSRQQFSKASLSTSPGNYARISQLLQAAHERGDIVDREDLHAKTESTRISIEGQDAARAAYQKVSAQRVKKNPLSPKRQKEVAKFEAQQKIEQRMEDHPEEFFSAEETKRRFDALLTGMMFTKPGIKLTKAQRAALPKIHEMSTEEMERIAAVKAEQAKAAREAAWERWEEKVAKGQVVGEGPVVKPTKALTAAEKAAIAAYKKPVTTTTRRLGPKPDAVAIALAKEAVAFCVETGMDAEAACKETGASFHRVKTILKEMRQAGANIGLADIGARQRHYDKAGKAIREVMKAKRQKLRDRD